MNGAFRTTLLMGILAAASAALAFYYYPQPAEIVVDAKVNQNLFENYPTNDVRSISITQYSSESNRIEQFRLRRRGDRWVIPRVGDYPATRIARIGEVAKSLLDRTVLSLATDDEQGHVEYGVVDPSEPSNVASRSSLGLRLDLLDRNKRELASLIVGKPVPGSTDGVPRHYVRIPGQPAVYEIEIPKQIFKTRFEDWVSPNLMELPPPGSADVTIDEIGVNKYSIDPEKMSDGELDQKYRIVYENGPSPVRKFEAFKDGDFAEQELSASQWNEARSTLETVGNIRFIDVVGKPKSVAKELRKPESVPNIATFKPMQQFGFRIDESKQFQSANGELSVTTSDGVTVRLLIGSLAQSADLENLDLYYHGMLLAQLDESTFAKPEKPQDVAEDSAENKAYLRKLEELERKQKSARLRIDELNRNWSKWIYVIPETTVNALLPDVSS